MDPYTVGLLYKGQAPLSLIEWSLSTSDKLGTAPLSLVQGTSWGLALCFLYMYSGGLLCKGQVGDMSFVPCGEFIRVVTNILILCMAIGSGGFIDFHCLLAS